MSKYTEDQFLEDVMAEAKALKATAKLKEVKNLEASMLDPFDYRKCIYGQMTGDCFSARAAELIFECCPRYFIGEIDEEGSGSLIDKDNGPMSLSAAIGFVNGVKVPEVKGVEDFVYHREHSAYMHFSSIEAYIVTKGAKIPELIAFLKDETQTLEL
jgi:hypothetical protein